MKILIADLPDFDPCTNIASFRRQNLDFWGTSKQVYS